MKKATLFVSLLLCSSMLMACSGNKKANTTPERPKEETKASTAKEEVKTETKTSEPSAQAATPAPEVNTAPVRGNRRSNYQERQPSNTLKDQLVALDNVEVDYFNGHFGNDDVMRDYFLGTWENNIDDVFIEFNHDYTYDIYETQGREIAWIEYGEYKIDEYGFIRFDGFLAGKYDDYIDRFKLQGYQGSFFKTSDSSHYFNSRFTAEYTSSREEYQAFHRIDSLFDENYAVTGYWYNYLEGYTIVLWEDGDAWILDNNMEVDDEASYYIYYHGDDEINLELTLESGQTIDSMLYRGGDSFELYLSGIEGSFTFMQDLSE